jgi:pyruvate ferredoxin oxidoreductase gamma subunit
MLGAVVQVSGVIPETEFMKDMEESLHHKFANKPHVIEPNKRALVRGMKEVKGV